MKNSIVLFLLIALAACSSTGMSLKQADKNAQSVFTYDYEIQNVEKDELWTRARDHFAKVYGDSNSVLKVQDKDSATLIGKGAASWTMMAYRCASQYSFQFMAKDGKARLQLELLYGAPSFSPCSGWDWPSESGYNEILEHFNRISSELEKALNEDDKFSHF